MDLAMAESGFDPNKYGNPMSRSRGVDEDRKDKEDLMPIASAQQQQQQQQQRSGQGTSEVKEEFVIDSKISLQAWGGSNAVGEEELPSADTVSQKPPPHPQTNLLPVAIYNRLRYGQPKASNDVDVHDTLRQAQMASLRKIWQTNREYDKLATSALRDLDLARTPVDSQSPASSRRAWAPESQTGQLASTEVPMDLDRKQEVAAPMLSSVQQPIWSEELDWEARCQAQDARQENAHWLFAPTTETAQQTKTAKKRSRWASKKDTKAVREVVDTDSNAWGSEMPSDATKRSNGSDGEFGKLLHKWQTGGGNEVHADYEGKMLPPPADWGQRARFNNNNEDFKQTFRNWIPSLLARESEEARFSNGIPFQVIPEDYLKRTDLHPDGIGLVGHMVTINAQNASRYGYTDDPEDVTKFAEGLRPGDLQDWGKVDLNHVDSMRFKNETTEDLVNNWLRHLANSQGKPGPDPTGHPSVLSKQPEQYQLPTHAAPEKPMPRIFLRPAVRADLPELTRIYNYYILNSPRPVEIREVTEVDMEHRFDFAESCKLPFIVAVRKVKNSGGNQHRGSRGRGRSGRKNWNSRSNEQYGETLAGWAAAQDFTASDYVEHITAEIELYVDPKFRRVGVGSCLMDKLLEACDRGHLPKSDYTWTCPQEISHLYSSGGGRDLHKVYFLLRTWKHPKIPLKRQKHWSGHGTKKDDLEDDYHIWLKKWLEDWGFEVEGHLKGVGARNGRFVDLVYVGRETRWQPVDGQVPEPLPGIRSGYGDDSTRFY